MTKVLKKFKFIFSLFITLALFGASVNCVDGYLINDNNVSISKDEYTFLEQIGYSQKEIMKLSDNDFEKLVSMNVIRTYRTNDVIYDDDIISVISNEQTTSIQTFAVGNLINPEMGTYEPNTPSGTYYRDSDGTKEMVTYVSVYIQNGEKKIYVKQNVKWTVIPTARFEDMIITNYTDNIRVSHENNLPDSKFKMYYTCTKYDAKDNQISAPKHLLVTASSDDQSFVSKLGEYVGYKFDLIADVGIPYQQAQFGEGSAYKYSNFEICLESRFDLNFPDLIGTELESRYIHQISMGSINMGNVSFTPVKPYISYTPSWDLDPDFEEALYNNINVRL